MAYIKQLDTIRAIAIFFVLCNHWLPPTTILQSISSYIAAPDIFFTISGFLITLILLKEKNKILDNNSEKTNLYINFFAKRALRIFPAYYLIVISSYLLDPNYVPDYKAYLNFTANFSIYRNQQWDNLAHLWSMSVEQQFYLLWPLIVIFTPNRFLLSTIIIFISIGIVSQYIIPNNYNFPILPHACFDALGLGALLAWLVVFKPTLLSKAYKVYTLLAFMSVFFIIYQFILNTDFYPSYRTLISTITSYFILHFILFGNKDRYRFSYIFDNRFLIIVGKMSYGIYLYHATLYSYSPKILMRLNRLFIIPDVVATNIYLLLAENFIILIAVSWLSWKYFEIPIMDLKKYIQIKNTRVTSTT